MVQCQREIKTDGKEIYIMNWIITYNDFKQGIPYDYNRAWTYAKCIGIVPNVDEHEH